MYKIYLIYRNEQNIFFNKSTDLAFTQISQVFKLKIYIYFSRITYLTIIQLNTFINIKIIYLF